MLNPLTANHPDDVTVVHYLCDWPGDGDPYYIDETQERINYYGVGGIPDVYFDGDEDPDLYESTITEYLGHHSFVDINGTYDLDLTPGSQNVSFDVDVQSYINAADVTLHILVLEILTTGNVGTNGETEFHHVIQKYAYGGAGNDIVLTDGSFDNFTVDNVDLVFTYIEEHTDLEFLAFVQDNRTKKVLQSKWISNANTIAEEKQNNYKAYPNPTNGIVYISGLEINNYKVLNLLGEVVLSGTGNQGNSIDLSVFNEGLYFIIAKDKEGNEFKSMIELVK